MKAVVPSRYQLEAALIAGTCIDVEGTERAILVQSFPRIPTGGRFAQQDLQEGLEILRQLELVRFVDAYAPTTKLLELLSLPLEAALELLLAMWLAEEAPLWLDIAVADGEVRSELIPDDQQDNLDSHFPDAISRNSFLGRLARRFDPEDLRRLGEAAEIWVMERVIEDLRARRRGDLAERVVRVSLVSDFLGYDIAAPRINGSIRHLEVKAVRKGEGLTFFLSRNEFQVGLRDPNWALVLCMMDASGSVRSCAWTRAEAVAEHAPIEESVQAKWQTLKVTLREADIRQGLPPPYGDPEELSAPLLQ